MRARKTLEKIGELWTAAGRPGKPRFVSGIQCVVGPEVAERGAATITS